MATFMTLCDETGIHHSATVTAIGGYVFDQVGYEQFGERWREILLQFADRGIEFFHAGECYERTGKFEQLKATESDQLFRRLIILIRETAKLGVICSLEDQASAT